MRISVLASGSKGNCVYVEGSSGALLIDAGRSGREILGTKSSPGRLREAGGSKDLVQGILVTHEHVDHIRGVNAMGNTLECPVYGTGGTLDLISRQSVRRKYDLKSVRMQGSFQVAGFTVQSFAVSHDAADPCGYLIEEDSTRLCYCTDTGVITESMREVLSRADGLVLESNHCPDMLRNGPYPAFLKRRIASAHGHLSNPDAAEVMRSLGDSLHLVILAHLSEENNEPAIAMRSAEEALSLHSDHVDLFVASSVEGETKQPMRKLRREDREICSLPCWQHVCDL